MNSCKYCESKNIVDQLRPDFMHYGEWRCQDCGCFLGWLKKPKVLPELIENCEFQLQRTGYEWQSSRVLNFCERICGCRFCGYGISNFCLKNLKNYPQLNRRSYESGRMQRKKSYAYPKRHDFCRNWWR